VHVAKGRVSYRNTIAEDRRLTLRGVSKPTVKPGFGVMAELGLKAGVERAIEIGIDRSRSSEIPCVSEVF
jgi:hypothetical protein